MSSARPQFAVVREDPELEAELVVRSEARSVLLVASGGCTALTLARRWPSLEVVAFDLNPAQLAHCREKAAERDLRRLNVEDADPAGLNQRGAFEGLFRVLRGVLLEFVTSAEEVEHFFAAEPASRATLLARWRAHPYWSTAFALAFGDALLNTMFGPAATQHAEPGSYPGYFQRVFERGLAAPDAERNPFLQHVLLGCYRRADAPAYVFGSGGDVTWVEGDLLAVPDLERFAVVSLSNVFDWSDDALVAAWAARLRSALRPGALVLMRQLNNQRGLRRFFESDFVFDEHLGAALLARDRSLFYERVEVARRA